MSLAARLPPIAVYNLICFPLAQPISLISSISLMQGSGWRKALVYIKLTSLDWKVLTSRVSQEGWKSYVVHVRRRSGSLL